MIISLGNVKGSVGKTTPAVNLTIALSLHHLPTTHFVLINFTYR